MIGIDVWWTPKEIRIAPTRPPSPDSLLIEKFGIVQSDSSWHRQRRGPAKFACGFSAPMHTVLQTIRMGAANFRYVTLLEFQGRSIMPSLHAIATDVVTDSWLTRDRLTFVTFSCDRFEFQSGTWFHPSLT